jgi:hypothetical protein
LIDGGATSRDIQTWAGHKSIKTTYDVYGHLFERAHDRARSIIDQGACHRPERAGDPTSMSVERVQGDESLLRIAVVHKRLVGADVVEGEAVRLAVDHLRVDLAGVVVGHHVLVEAR